MKNRSRNEIIASILEIISRGRSATTTRTKIMYGSFVSYNQLNEYLLLLLENNLISQHHQQHKKKNERDSPLFMITEKGTQFLTVYNQMNEMITTTTTLIQTN
ncbi:MAG TPA: winged helix-turn-helix domain-containing protein [Nitrososphaeraceae archaeon]|nr:winged helix-turn-helix domain-containing protein [Nitrososphaeraceae archaeon]